MQPAASADRKEANDMGALGDQRLAWSLAMPPGENQEAGAMEGMSLGVVV
jgi:hypothetical protein